jgi:hypothetical protein
MEVSAKTGHNVNELFKAISMHLTGNEPSQIVQNGASAQEAGQPRSENIRLEEAETEAADKKNEKRCC